MSFIPSRLVVYASAINVLPESTAEDAILRRETMLLTLAALVKSTTCSKDSMGF